jgi:hypothetical protein
VKTATSRSAFLPPTSIAPLSKFHRRSQDDQHARHPLQGDLQLVGERADVAGPIDELARADRRRATYALSEATARDAPVRPRWIFELRSLNSSARPRRAGLRSGPFVADHGLRHLTRGALAGGGGFTAALLLHTHKRWAKTTPEACRLSDPWSCQEHRSAGPAIRALGIDLPEATATTPVA